MVLPGQDLAEPVELGNGGIFQEASALCRCALEQIGRYVFHGIEHHFMAKGS